MGGNLALNCVLRRQAPIAGAIVTGAWLRLVCEVPERKLRLARLLVRVWPTFAQETGLSGGAMTHDAEAARRYETDLLNHDSITLRTFFALQDAARYALGHAAQMGVPLLIMHGGDDAICDAEASREFAEAVPRDCTLKIWDGQYYEIHNEPCGESVRRVMYEWIKGHTADPPRRL